MAIIFVVIASALIAYFLVNKNADLAVKVNGVGITNTQYDASVAGLNTFYAKSNQSIDATSLQQTALNNLIDKQLIESYAKDNNIIISAEQIDDIYNQRVSAYPNEQALLDKLNELYGTNKDSFLETLRYDLLREELQKSTNQPLDKWLAEQKDSANIKVYIKL